MRKFRIIIIILIFVLIFSVLFYLSFAIVYWISPVTGTAGAFAIVAALLLFLLFIIYSLRKPLIIRPLIRFLTNTLLS